MHCVCICSCVPALHDIVVGVVLFLLLLVVFSSLRLLLSSLSVSAATCISKPSKQEGRATEAHKTRYKTHAYLSSSACPSTPYQPHPPSHTPALPITSSSSLPLDSPSTVHPTSTRLEEAAAEGSLTFWGLICSRSALPFPFVLEESRSQQRKDPHPAYSQHPVSASSSSPLPPRSRPRFSPRSQLADPSPALSPSALVRFLDS